MGKTYFNLVDQLNFNGNNIKMKGAALLPLEKQETAGSVTFGTDLSQIYQSVLSSQPQMHSVESVKGLPVEVYLGVMNSSPQASKISIEGNEKDGYVAKTSVNLNKVSMRDTSAASAKVDETEKIVVAGLQVSGKFKYQFIETALHDIDVMIEKGVSPSDITWMVFWHNQVYQSYDKEHFQETADTLGIKLKIIERKNQFINYINSKNISGHGKGRDDIKISRLTVFGHGQTPIFTGGKETQLSFGYGLDELLGDDVESNINFIQSDIESINVISNAFSANAVTYFFTCNTGTAGKDGLRFAQLWANKTKGDTWAFTNARSNYTFMNSSMDEINAAFNLPGDKYDFAISDIINGLREKGNEAAASLGEEALTLILGEKNRYVAEFISLFIEPLPVTEEWRIKRERGEDRKRVDMNKIEYGYAEKGSVQYPMINNIRDDWDIIKKTLTEPRGFIKFTPQ